MLNNFQKKPNNYLKHLQGSFMFLKKYSLLYCWIHKAASSSWSRIFFEMSNMPVPGDDFLHAANHLFRPKENVSLRHLFNISTVSFAIVRHPFERLVSAFRDKFELAALDDWFFKFYAADIFSLPDSAYLTGEGLRRPSFPQFVSYLLETSVMDYNDHWLPYWLHCKFCDYK